MTRISRIVPILLAVLLLIADDLSAQKSVLVGSTGSSGGKYAAALAPVGDADGDGLLDLLVADPFDDSVGTDAGRVQLLSGADGSVLYSIAGDQAGDLFGFSVAPVGDLDDDGLADFVVGAPGLPGSSATGYARVFSGADGSTLYTFTGAQAGGQFGAAVGSAATLMVDNEPGVIVGAPCEGLDDSQAGAVHVFSGADGSLLASIPGAAAGDGLGASVAGDRPASLGGSGALLVDNEPGVIVGATAGGNGGNGYVLLLRRSDLGVLARVDGDAALDAFGSSVASLADVDGDGVTDFAAGSAPTGGAAGYARILSGADGSTLQSFTTTDTGTGFGSHVAWVGDLSGDGIDDLAVSEPGADGNGADAGRAHIYSGADGSAIHTVNGPTGSRFSAAVAYAGDLDGDGLTDVAIGAPTKDNGAAPAGTVYVLSLTRVSAVGSGEAGENGVPLLRTEGEAGADPELVLYLDNARASATATLVIGSSLTIVNDKPVPTADSVIGSLLTETNGTLEYAFTLPSGLPTGFTLYYQFRVADPIALGGISRSNTIAVMLP